MPEHDPVRYWCRAGQLVLEHVEQLNPSLVPLHEPLRYPLAHSWLEHVVHVPLAVGDDPLRYWPLTHVGCFMQVPSVLPLT